MKWNYEQIGQARQFDIQNLTQAIQSAFTFQRYGVTVPSGNCEELGERVLWGGPTWLKAWCTSLKKEDILYRLFLKIRFVSDNGLKVVSEDQNW